MKNVRCQVYLNHMFRGKKKKSAQVAEAHPSTVCCVFSLSRSPLPVPPSLSFVLFVSNTIRAAVDSKESTPPSSYLLSVLDLGKKKVLGLNRNAICLPTAYCFLWRPSRLILCDTTNPQSPQCLQGLVFVLGSEKNKKHNIDTQAHWPFY